MKQFEIPAFYRSPIIQQVKAKRRLEDPRKKDFTPTEISFNNVVIVIPRHFGFCYGVENAIEKSYRALEENPGKNIFLLSQMIHNPEVNADLEANGIRFMQDTDGTQLIPFDYLTSEDIVLIPAFGTTLEIESILRNKGIDIVTYNTTCPFVEKVWNRSQKLGEKDHTIIIHGKHDHEETRATFSHSQSNAPSLVIKNMNEAILLGKIISGDVQMEKFYASFEGKFSKGFDPEIHLTKIGIVNQTTMLATETQSITDYLRQIMVEKFGEENIKNHIADTRDTLCYATNDNQSSTYALMESNLDLSIVVGGFNSSNTTHLVEILENSSPTYFINGEQHIINTTEIHSFNIHQKILEQHHDFLPNHRPLRIGITSGASCPDAIVDKVLMKLLSLLDEVPNLEEALKHLT